MEQNLIKHLLLCDNNECTLWNILCCYSRLHLTNSPDFKTHPRPTATHWSSFREVKLRQNLDVPSHPIWKHLFYQQSVNIRKSRCNIQLTYQTNVLSDMWRCLVRGLICRHWRDSLSMIDYLSPRKSKNCRVNKMSTLSSQSMLKAVHILVCIQFLLHKPVTPSSLVNLKMFGRIVNNLKIHINQISLTVGLNRFHIMTAVQKYVATELFQLFIS